MKKIVGIMPLYDDERESYWMLPGYMKTVSYTHLAIPAIFPVPTREAVEIIRA